MTSGAGDFRENLAPIEVANCDGSKGQQFDVIVRPFRLLYTGLTILTTPCVD